MSLCHRVKRGWNTFKNTVYGYDEAASDPKRGKRAKEKEEKERATNYEYYFSTGNLTGDTRRDDQEYKPSLERTRGNYFIAKDNTKYEAYGIEFGTRLERDAFECKMESMERVFEKELYDIKKQHIRLRQERFKSSFTSANVPKQANINKSQNTWSPVSFSVSDNSTFSQGSGDSLVEEMSLLNELQDVYEQMFNLSKALMNIENILKIEVRERTLYPEPRLIHVNVPEDIFSQQMKSDGGLRYCSSDSSIQQITYETLPPPLALDDLLAKERQRDT